MTTVRQETPPALKRTSAPLRVAVIGCGAMARDFHLPVLAGHDQIRVAALVDRDTERARQLGHDYGIATVLDDSTKLDRQTIDAALVVTPPFHHAPCALDLVRRGIHVLVEKPMALTSAEAEAMVRAADEAGVVLAVGHHRRLYHSTRMLRALLESQYLCRPLSFDVEEGGTYSWPLASMANLRKDQGGGGVLFDIGSHLLDQLLFCFPGSAEVLEYRDNALGGIETDCEATLRLSQQEETVEGRLELSRTRSLRNSLRIDCEHGTIELHLGDRYRLVLQPRDLSLVDPLPGSAQPYRQWLAWDGVTETVGRGAYRLEMDDWLGAIQTGRPPLLAGKSAVAVVRLMEDCYRCAGRLEEPWVHVGLGAQREAHRNGSAPAHLMTSTRPQRVLVTGATGFIGCRLAEILHLREGCQVRALVHKPGSAARLARLPIEMVLGDLDNPAALVKAVEGCDAVVHCAVGPSWQARREVFAANVNGTRNLIEACHKASVNRFVHLSTIAVYGTEVPAVVDETTPVRPDRQSSYAASKAAAEDVVAKAARHGLPAVILRPAHVYGPFGKTFITNPLQHLARGALVLVDPQQTPSNTIHVDNVAEAIIRALLAPRDVVVGHTFTLGAEDDLTWAGFYGYFAEALGLSFRTLTAAEYEKSRPASRSKGFLSWPGLWYRGAKEILTSAELRSFARRCVQTDPYGRLPRWLIERFPRLRKLLKLDAPVVYRPVQPTASPPLTMSFIPARIGIDKARKLLGYEPALSRSEALETTLAWVRHTRLIETGEGR
jgi:predicted dehydrogenase/nucleoside-diphosphate-sugar epimerase